MTNIEHIKKLLSEDRHRIELYDELMSQVRTALAATGEDRFSSAATFSPEGFKARITSYEVALRGLCETQGLIGFWSDTSKRSVITIAPQALAPREMPPTGNESWMALRWYPTCLLFYSGGIAATYARRYESLRDLFLTEVEHNFVRRPLVAALASGMADVGNLFELISGNVQTPKSEHLYNFFAPHIESILSIGFQYEDVFDEFEILYALECAYQRSLRPGWPHGLVGRFGWKYHHDSSPYKRVIAEAVAAAENWAPIKAGLFGGSFDTFADISDNYGRYLASIPNFR